jgi:fructokinase
MIRIGIDVGGTKIEAIALDLKGKELFRTRIPTPRGNYPATVQNIIKMVDEIERRIGKNASIGLGTPGVISPATGLMKNSSATWLNGKAFDQDLEQSLKRRVRMHNNANCLAVSESIDGAAAGFPVVFAVILGAGVGAGIALNQTAILGANAIAGEFGHNSLPWPSQNELDATDCYCGKKNCIETWLSGPGFARDHEINTGQKISAFEIHNRLTQKDPDAIRSLGRYEDRLARSLASVINILDPDVIVLGGGMSNIDRIYRNLPALIAKWSFSDRIDTVIRPAQHGDNSGVRGAAYLWKPDEVAEAIAML